MLPGGLTEYFVLDIKVCLHYRYYYRTTILLLQQKQGPKACFKMFLVMFLLVAKILHLWEIYGG